MNPTDSVGLPHGDAEVRGVSETFTCRVHQVEIRTDGNGCELCIAAFPLREHAEAMTPDERVAELERLCGQVTMPVRMIFQRISELVGRPVYTHEIALAFDQLREEAWSRTGEMPDEETVIARAELSGKPVVVVRIP